MQQPIYQVDAFTSDLFGGNPAAVCPLQAWLPNATLQRIAQENNLSETAYFVPKDKGYELRWFTPAVEVNLCGHATLATAHVLFSHLGYPTDAITFYSKSGVLTVTRQGHALTLNFPANAATPLPMVPEPLFAGLGIAPAPAYQANEDVMVVLGSQAEVAALTPDFGLLNTIKARGIIVTAPGQQVDFVSRFFAPRCGIDEDPVTGSAHTVLAPFWAQRLQKNTFEAIQLSARQGHLHCQLDGNRVLISGQAVTYLQGHIEIP